MRYGHATSDSFGFGGMIVNQREWEIGCY